MTNGKTNGDGPNKMPPPSGPKPAQSAPGPLSGLSAQDFAGTAAGTAPFGAQPQPGKPVTSQPTPGQTNPTVAHMFGEMVWLLTQSQFHKHFSLGDLEWMIMPALLMEQFRVFRTGATPVALALWAKVGPEVDQKLTSGPGKLRPDEWRSGNINWVIDVIVPSVVNNPEKVRAAVLQDLQATVFKDQEFKFRTAEPSQQSTATKVVSSKSVPK